MQDEQKEAKFSVLEVFMLGGLFWRSMRKSIIDPHAACVASVSVGIFLKHFSLFGRAKIETRAKKVRVGEGEGRKRSLNMISTSNMTSNSPFHCFYQLLTRTS